MNKLDLLLKNERLRIINHTNEPNIMTEKNNPLADFAVDDAIATVVGQKKVAPTIRFWVHPNTVVLGIIDGKLPYLIDGLQYLQSQSYNAVIRNSGGLAVLLNSGVLNMSVIIPNDQVVSINDGYDMMFAFIQALLQPYTNKVKAYEIVGSYCPGDYDLSIDGKKFAGISQRRVRNGVAIQIYIDVEGSSEERALIVQKFYECSIQNRITKYNYPKINPKVMSSLNELLLKNFTVMELIEQIKTYLSHHGIYLEDSFFLQEEENVFISRYKQMIKRNEDIRTFNPS